MRIKLFFYMHKHVYENELSYCHYESLGFENCSLLGIRWTPQISDHHFLECQVLVMVAVI